MACRQCTTYIRYVCHEQFYLHNYCKILHILRTVVYVSCGQSVTHCSLSVNAAKTAVQAFVSTRLDYCNSLMNGIADGLMQRLQAVQNAATCLITGARRRDHISPAFRQLHWLPVRQRVQFKLAVLVFKALHGLVPQCLTQGRRKGPKTSSAHSPPLHSPLPSPPPPLPLEVGPLPFP